MTPRVAVIGAGPAGAIAAILLARGGAAVTLFERDRWPREKACGDGLTPASVAALRGHGIALPSGPALRGTLVSGPGEDAFRADWPPGFCDGTTLRRATFDATLVEAAVAAGARFESETAIAACAGARISRRGGFAVTEGYDAVMLAEGATGALGAACGLGSHTMRLAAYRGYAAARDVLADDYEVHYARGLVPGYAWIFPVAPRRANVGAVVAGGGDIRARLRDWLATSAYARRSLGTRVVLEETRGGIIPIGRAKRYADGVFAIGDAAGVADPLSAEGVSQAIGSATLAVEALLEARGDVAVAGRAFEASVRRYDTNNREALRMRRLFTYCADPLIALAKRRPALARHVVATGYFEKTNAGWFSGTFGALVGR